MRFVGIDLAWGARNTSGAVALHGVWQEDRLILDSVAHADALHADDELLNFVKRADDGGGMVIGIDAPLDVPNETGERPVESLLRRCFGPYQAGAHPANRRLYHGDVRGERLAARLAAEHDIHNDFRLMPCDSAVRRCLEVFPHPAQVVLFGLSRTLKYKARPGRNYDSRWAEFARLLTGIRSLQTLEPSLTPPDWLTPPDGLIGGALKRYEDRLDALICAYVAAYFWRWGDDECCMVIGDALTGYVVSPITPALRACLQREGTVNP